MRMSDWSSDRVLFRSSVTDVGNTALKGADLLPRDDRLPHLASTVIGGRRSSNMPTICRWPHIVPLASAGRRTVPIPRTPLFPWYVRNQSLSRRLLGLVLPVVWRAGPKIPPVNWRD